MEGKRRLGEGVHGAQWGVGGGFAPNNLTQIFELTQLDKSLDVSYLMDRMYDLLRHMCEEWLYKNFHLKTNITYVKFLGRNRFDFALGTIPLKFEFETTSGRNGDGVVFFDIEEIRRSLDWTLNMKGNELNEEI
jgi:hypothetical protein